jgi:hypothetical protein
MERNPMPEFVARFARTIHTAVRYEAADEAEAAKMAEAMRIAFEAIEPCDVAVTKIQTAQDYEDYLEGLRETDPEPPLQ